MPGSRDAVVLMLFVSACVPAGIERTRSTAGRSEDPARDAGTSFPIADDGGVQSKPTPVDGGVVSRDGGVIPRDGGDMCFEGPTKPPPEQAVYYGTSEPTEVALTPGQQLAIGKFSGCSGLLITPTWVLTAEHCGLRTGTRFCIGQANNNPNICFTGRRVVDNPAADMTLVELNRDARELAPTVEPVAIFTDTLDQSWIGTIAEASGYGQQENGRSGEREFTAEPIVSILGNLVTIDGQGQRGVCFGDSGGPLFVTAADGSARVIGDLSHGDQDCLGRDNYTRVDRHRGWIEGYTGPTLPPGPQPCGDVDEVGSCNGDFTIATYCNSDELQVDNCNADQICGFSPTVDGWRCLDLADDPCGGVTSLGQCNDNVLSWCDRGTLLSRDCGACDETCLPYETAEFGFDCVPND